MATEPTEPAAERSDRADALAVVRRLRDAGHVAYFAGGCVRDALLGLEPKDYDVATDAPPTRVRELFRNSQAVGAAFGVILVRHGGSQVEVATFRSDGAYADGRRPTEVRFTTAEEDAKRRDFTINGLFYDPVEERVIDYVGGREDLNNKLLRAIGDPDQRFEEDHLRLLRAVRFASRFGLDVEPATAAAISRHAGRLKRISPERVAEELRATLTAPSRPEAWKALWDFGLVDVVMRFLPEKEPSLLDPARSVFLALCPGKSVSFGSALAAATLCFRAARNGGRYGPRYYLAKDEVQRAAAALRQALKISNQELDETVGTLYALRPLLADPFPTVAMMKRFLSSPTAEQSIDLMNALGAAGHCRERVAKLLDAFWRLSGTDWAPAPLITGDDLAAAGLKPGPVFKRVLDAVYDEQLEGRVATKEQALALALSLSHAPQ